MIAVIPRLRSGRTHVIRTRIVLTAAVAALVSGVLLSGCGPGRDTPDSTRDGASPPAQAGDPSAAAVRLAFRVPAESEIPDGPLGVSIRRGRALLNATRDSLPAHVGNGLRCTSCHLDDGQRPDAMSWVGVYARFPQYRSRSAAVLVMADRVNDCFLRSMNGSPLPADGPDMRDMIAYMAFLSRGYPVGSEVEGQGLPKMEPLEGDSARGAELFITACSVCHGVNGQGTQAAPALWGPESYNIGAGMARLRTAASFIRHNMPFGNPNLTDQQAFDVAAYVNSHPRPDLPGKENDWPRGDAPPDAAYPTRAARAASAGAGAR